MEQYKYKLFQTNKFKKDYKKIRKRSDFAGEEFEFVVNTLLKGEKLQEKYCNHQLQPKIFRLL